MFYIGIKNVQLILITIFKVKTTAAKMYRNNNNKINSDVII